MVHPRTGAVLRPTWLHETAPRSGRASETDNALDSLADRLTRNNPQFSRNLVNRVWFHLFGRGIVEPVDDFRDSNPPANPALLDALSAYFEANGMRLKPLVAWIMKSRAYQLSATPDPTNVDGRGEFLACDRSTAPRRGAAGRHQPGFGGPRTLYSRTEVASRVPAPRSRDRRLVPENLRQARPSCSLASVNDPRRRRWPRRFR